MIMKTAAEQLETLLRGIDQIAYIRFASVYRSFEDLEDLKREVDSLYAERDSTDDGFGKHGK